MNRQAEGEWDQGVGWLGSATDRRQCLEEVGRTGQVASSSSLRKEEHNTGTVGLEGRNARQLAHCGKCLYNGGLGYRQDKERSGISAGVVLGSWCRGGQWLAAEGDQMWLWRHPSCLRRCCRRLSSAAGYWIRLWHRSSGCSSGQC